MFGTTLTVQEYVEAAQRIAQLGYDSIEHYQALRDLVVDGVLGKVTADDVWQKRFCGCPDVMDLGRDRLRQYPRGRQITYFNMAAIPGFTLDETREVTDLAWKYLNELSGLTADRGTNYRTATVLMQVGKIDGRNGTLAWSELANLPQTRQMYDNAERWTRGKGKRIATNGIDLLPVVMHECLHACGLPHKQGGSASLMSPTYNPRAAFPGEWEQKQMIARYGQHKDQPEQPSTPTPAPPAPNPTPSPEPSPELVELTLRLRKDQISIREIG